MSGAIQIVRFASHKDNRPAPHTVTWGELVEMLRDVRRTVCTVENCVHAECANKRGFAWSPAVYAKGAKRGNENVEAITALVFDHDHIKDADTLGELSHRLGRHRHIIHASHSDRVGDRCVRSVVALSRPVLAAEWRRFYAAAVDALALPQVDPSTKDPARLFFLPSRPVDADFFFASAPGEPLDVDAVLARSVGNSEAAPSKPTASPPPDGIFTEGNRHAALIRMAGAMRATGADAVTIFTALETFNARSCVPPKSTEELRGIAGYLEAKPGLAVNAEDEWTYGNGLASFLGDDEPDDDDSGDWHIRGLIARDVAGFLAGDPKVGKTMIMESWGVALAMGAADWCDFPLYGRKRVLLMPREDSERTTKIRLWQLARGAGLQRPHDLAGWLDVEATKPLNLGNPGHIERLRAACARFDVIIIDSFTTAHLGDENSAKDIARAMEPARDLAVSTKTSIVFVHHFNGKGNADDKRGVKHRLRGSSALAGYARHIVGVSHGPKRGQLQIASDGNLAHQIEPVVVGLVSGTTSTGKSTLAYKFVGAADAANDGVRDAVVAAVAAEDDGFASRNALCKALGGNRGAVLAAVKLELVPGGRLSLAGKRICLRSLVPGTSQNHPEPGTGTGTPPLRGYRNHSWHPGES